MALATKEDIDYAGTSKGQANIVEDSNVSQQLVSSYRVNKAGPSDLIELAKEVQRADEDIKNVASGKLQMIAEQMRFLQQQANHVLMEARESSRLHNAKCNLVKKPGNVYYLYERDTGVQYFSLLSPSEWPDCPHTFICAYRLEHDKTWTKLDDIQRRDQEMKIIDDLMRQGSVPALQLMANNPVSANVIEGADEGK